MKLLNLFIFLLSTFSCGKSQTKDVSITARQSDTLDFIDIEYGRDHGKLFFAFRNGCGMLDAIDRCLNVGMTSATIDTISQNNMIFQYLAGSNHPKKVWLPATDLQTEGTYTWIRTKSPVTFSNWRDGFSKFNRTTNCVVMESDGYWTEEICNEINASPLCEAPLFNNTSEKTEELKIAKTARSTAKNKACPLCVEQILKNLPSTAKVSPIGGVGTKLYFSDDTHTVRGFTDLLHFCHQLGMRLVSPGSAEEYQFLRNYSIQLSMNGEPYYIMTSGSDMMAVNCNMSNSIFRWFYSEEEIQINVNGTHGYYSRCLMVYPGEQLFLEQCWRFTYPTAVCELDTAGFENP